MKGVVRFGKRGKLNPRYVGSFPIIERIGNLAYRVQLPEELASIHNVFHVSMLRKYLADESHVLKNIEWPDVISDFSILEYLLRIEDRREQKLRNKVIPLVKVIWQRHSGSEATWEREDEMRQQFPYLFEYFLSIMAWERP